MRVLQLFPSVFSLLLTFVQSRSTVSVTLSLSAPSNAPTISPSLVSFSIEQDRWTDWAGTTSRNQFTYNVLDNFKGLTGVPPQIRIGADSEDHTVFNPSVQFSNATFPDPTATVPYPEALNISVGDGYYQAARFLPAGAREHTRYLGLNLGANNITNAVLEAGSLVKAFSSQEMKSADVVLDFIELGNEADLYRNNGLRPSNYSPVNYTADWIKMATNVSRVSGISSTSHTKFLVGGFAGSSHTTTDFSPQAIYAAGILDSVPGKFITSFSEHRYSGSFCSGNGGLLQDLMTKATIRSNLSIFGPDIQATHAKGLEYILGETNSYACHGAPGVSNTAGAALWTLDYALFATQLGISRLFFHEGVGYKYNLIQPVELTRSTLDGSPLPAPLPPHVQPQYYAAVIAGEAIGKTGGAQAVEVPIDNTRLAGYAFYEHGALARAVFINSRAHFANATRSVIHVGLDYAGSSTAKPTTAHVKRLAIGLADDVSGLKWGGQTYETADGRVQGQLKVDDIQVVNGFNIQDSEAVLLSF
ncbi:glycoside hydrolase family 79 protein [Hymenopellis radicata]|nr:glycoside hydrolase family 79 protein [Hymenopellis radicata]